MSVDRTRKLDVDEAKFFLISRIVLAIAKDKKEGESALKHVRRIMDMKSKEAVDMKAFLEVQGDWLG